MLETVLYNQEKTPVNVKSIVYTTNGGQVIGTDTSGYTLPAESVLTVPFTYTPEESGLTTITANVFVELSGQEYSFSQDLKLDVKDFSCPRDDTCPMTPFTDADKQEWYHDGVHWAIEKGIMNGTGESTFEPLTATTRAMIVTMLWRMEGSPQVSDGVTFKDVQDGQWYTDAIRWAAANGIVKGYDEDTFGTNDPVTREQLATILYRSIKAKGQGFNGTWSYQLDFDDADQVSEFAYEPLCWMNMNGIIRGMSDKELSPQGDAVRAQVATMLMRCKAKIQV